MTVVILTLSGLDAAAGLDAVERVLAARDTYPHLDKTLIIDDTGALTSHTGVFEHLLRSRRLDHVLCVAVGPGRRGHAGADDTADGRPIRIPSNISSSQGSALLWVGDPDGIDCPLLAGAIADGHTGSSSDGLQYLIEVLSVDEVFEKVLELVRGMPDGVASPGLRLADADDEAAAFTAALALAIQRITGPGSGPAAATDTRFTALLPGTTGVASLVPGGELASYHDRIASSVRAVSAAIAKPAGGFLRRAAPDARADVIAIGGDLAVFRERVRRLFTDAHASGEPGPQQRDAVIAAGVSLPAALGGAQAESGTGEPDSAPTLVRRTVADAVRGGSTLPWVIGRLNLAAQQLKHAGSGAYLAEVDKICPAGLLSQLASPPERPAGKAAAEAWRTGLGTSQAAVAADGLASLVARVATREWSGTAAVADEVSRTRIALDGISQKLTDHAAAIDPAAVSGARAARRAWLSDTLSPILADLVDKVIAAESATPSSDGQEAFQRAQDKTAELIADWTRQAAENGATSRPWFATSAVHDHTHTDDDLATLRDALRHDPMDRMWQLCEPYDLGVLDVNQAPRVVAFASRMVKEALGKGLPDDMTWTASGSHAGLLRLVPLRSGTAWTENEPPEPAELAS